jgi:hypothetical protein
MLRFMHNEYIAIFQKLIIASERDPSRDEDQHKMLLKLLADEEVEGQAVKQLKGLADLAIGPRQPRGSVTRHGPVCPKPPKKPTGRDHAIWARATRLLSRRFSPGRRPATAGVFGAQAPS